MTRIPPSVALAVLLASAGLAGSTLLRAFDLDPVPSPDPVSSLAREREVALRPVLAASRLSAAVGKNPFHPERRRPAVRFRMPGESEPGASDSTQARAPFKLIGTAAMAKGKGFAMCQWGEEPPRLVRIGERVGDYTLQGVMPGKAVFLSASGKRYEVRVPKAGS